MDPLFTRAGDTFVPGELTRTGWNDYTQHGGPPTALMVWAIEQVPTLVPMHTVRFTVDLIRPVPIAPLTVATTVIREGKNVQWVQAELARQGTRVARTTALRVRHHDVEMSGWEDDGIVPARLEDAEPTDWSAEEPIDGLERFHRDAVEIRSPTNAFLVPGPGVAFVRLLTTVVDDEPAGPLLHLACVADLANGLSSRLPYLDYVFVNPDITVAIHRLPQGQWIGLAGESFPRSHGVGVADTMVFDEYGQVGRILQTQLVAGRGSG